MNSATSLSVELNSNLGEGFGPWMMGEDAARFEIVTRANIACGGHAGDPETMLSNWARLIKGVQSMTSIAAVDRLATDIVALRLPENDSASVCVAATER